MIFFALIAAVVSVVVWAIVRHHKTWKKSPRTEDYMGIVLGSTIVAAWIISMAGIPLTTVGEPNQQQDHTAPLQSLVEQAGGSGEGAYVRFDYTYGMEPSQVITYAAKGKLHQADGTYVRIKPVTSVDDARVTVTSYQAHRPWLVPWYSAASYHDLTTIYVPKDAITYGTATEPAEE